ncbi:MAG: hypothetical protein KC910_29065 [Candidatus Eremiobacteraeota bacterium]|nr:hypothetical protein [Candidatus Eremiobacteraeota bacterium]
MVAIFVASIGLLGTASVLWYSLKAEKGAEQRLQAVFWAREMLNTIRARNLSFQPDIPRIPDPINDGNYDDDSDDEGPRRAFNAAPFAEDFPDLNFQRRIEMKRVSSDPLSHMYNVAAIKVTLFWSDGERTRSVTLCGYHRRP